MTNNMESIKVVTQDTSRAVTLDTSRAVVILVTIRPVHAELTCG